MTLELDPEIKEMLNATVLATSHANALTAEKIANELDAKGSDISGPAALRLFAQAVRITNRTIEIALHQPVAGHA